MRGAIIAAAIAFAGAATAQAPSFTFDPKPRWAEDPDTDVVCEAVRAECKGILKDGEIDVDWNYEELYDPDGMLVGVKSLQSTGCKPLDEHLVLDHAHFVHLFTDEGKPDLDDITAELAPGTSKDAVRLIKKGTMQVSFGCNS
jgi:hypothetical protein